MITRRKDYTKRAPSKDAGKIYIICEGKSTEPDYFSFFEGLSSNLQLIVIPPEAGTDPLKLMAQAQRLLLSDAAQYAIDYMQHDQIWFAIDTDSWAAEGKIRPLRDFCKRQNEAICRQYSEVKAYEAWRVAQSNPCFEIWLYYHHYDAPPCAEDVLKHPSMKAFVNSCIAGGFDHQKDQTRLETAIANAGANFFRQDDNSLSVYATEQYLLGQEILPFVKSELDKLRNKM